MIRRHQNCRRHRQRRRRTVPDQPFYAAVAFSSPKRPLSAACRVTIIFLRCLNIAVSKMLQNTPPVIRGRQDDGAGRHEPGIVSARTGVRPRVLFLNGDAGGGGDRDIFVVLPATKRRVGDGGRVRTEMRRSFSVFVTRRGPLTFFSSLSSTFSLHRAVAAVSLFFLSPPASHS